MTLKASAIPVIVCAPYWDYPVIPGNGPLLVLRHQTVTCFLPYPKFSAAVWLRWVWLGLLRSVILRDPVACVYVDNKHPRSLLLRHVLAPGALVSLGSVGSVFAAMFTALH